MPFTLSQFYELFPGEEVAHARGRFYLARQPAVRHAETSPQIAERLRSGVASLSGGFDMSPSTPLFLDIETTGLSRRPLFLVGTMFPTDAGDFEVVQFFARNYAEEAALLAALNEWWQTFDALVTFNGATFDLPFIRQRMREHGIRFDSLHSHTDVLDWSRRRWKRAAEVPNHQLQTLERHICGRRRIGDIPSSEIPAAYEDFVRTGEASTLREIFRHNVHDLLTTAELLAILLESPKGGKPRR